MIQKINLFCSRLRVHQKTLGREAENAVRVPSLEVAQARSVVKVSFRHRQGWPGRAAVLGEDLLLHQEQPGAPRWAWLCILLVAKCFWARKETGAKHYLSAQEGCVAVCGTPEGWMNAYLRQYPSWCKCCCGKDEIEVATFEEVTLGRKRFFGGYFASPTEAAVLPIQVFGSMPSLTSPFVLSFT